MKNQRLLLLGLLLGALAAWLFTRHQPAKAPPPEIAIQDGRTIDFSSGRAVVKDSPEDRAALERARREMEEAAKDVRFAPTTPAPSPTATNPPPAR